ncbi:hypothetical protein IKP85_07020 [bacterium]|nr:hypothetical protein [bacterium]
MKKLVLISLLSIIFTGSQVSAEVIRSSEFYNKSDYLEALDEEFFENGNMAPLDNAIVDPNLEETEENFEFGSLTDGDYTTKPLKGMPLFKKYRIKIQNHYRIKEHEQYLKDQQQMQMQSQIPAMDDFDEDIDDEYINELTNRTVRKKYVDENGNEIKVSLFDRIKKFFNRNKDDDDTETNRAVVTDGDGLLEGNTDSALVGGVREVAAQKDMILDCDKLNYDDDTSELEAVGNPVMKFPPQKAAIKAKRITYNTESNIIKAYDDVEITKDDSTIYGDYVMINLNDESSIVTNMKTEKMNMFINAKEVVASEDTLELRDGSMSGDKHYTLRLRSGMMGTRLGNIVVPEDQQSNISKDGLDIQVKAQEIYVTAKKYHDVVTVKNADIYFKDKYIANLSSLTSHTNKGQEYFEANYPEFGTIPRIGMFAGPGFVFDVPNGATLKVIPFANYKNKFGIGAGLKYRSGTNYTEMYYGSANDMLVMRGRQFFDDRFFMQYGINSYQDDWFLGSNMAKYRVEAVYRDSTIIPHTLGYGRSARYRQRVSFGYMQNSNYDRKGERIKSSNMGTTRLKYMAELSQNLYSYANEDNTLQAQFNWRLQGSAAVYGTGDTQFIARTGPVLHTQYKRWIQDIGYFVTGTHDETPLRKVDLYRYGRSTLTLREAVRINKYLTMAWRISSALSNDAPNHKTFQENGLFLSIGPDDLKVTLGYDFIRDRTYLLLNTALDLKGTKVDYKKLVIKNPESLGRDKSEKVEPITFDYGPKTKVKRTHAQVINIEDPDREQL